MAHALECPGAGCALHGALYAASAIPGVVPIVHGPSGCGYQAALAAPFAGWLDGGSLSVPSTNLSEKQVVFGGASRLREEIKNAVKVASGELYAVLSTCPTEMIGDDIPAMTREARAQGFPVIDAPAAGFRGGVREGYAAFLKAIIESGEISDKSPINPSLVNLLGIAPLADATWAGEIEEWSRLLAGIGLRANPLFGPSGGVEGLRNLSSAALSLVLTSWGRGAADALQAKFGVPWIEANGLPVGAKASADILWRIRGSLDDPQDVAEAFIASELKREDWYLNRLAHAYHALELQRVFALVASGAQALGLTGFLIDTLGWLPGVIIVADDLAPEDEKRIGTGIGRITSGSGKILFTQDVGEIADAIAEAESDIVLGRAIERATASRCGAPLVEVAYPIRDRIVLGTPLSGSRGALALIEAISSAILCHRA